jgi:hypothetical protein
MGIEKYLNYLMYFSGSEALPIYKLSNKKVELLLNDISVVKKAEQTLFYYPQMIKKNIQQFIEYKQKIDVENGNTKDILNGFYNSTEIMVSSNGLVLNILTSFRSYIDNVSHMISQQFGSESDLLRYFTKTQETIFDSDFSYRFMARYRNYVQHSGLPINDIVADEEQLKYYDKYSSKLLVKKSELLKYDGWGPVKKDFENYSEDINVFGIVEQFNNSIDILIDSMFMYITRNDIYNFQYFKSQYKATKGIYQDKDIALITKKDQSNYTFNVFPKYFLEKVTDNNTKT